jgi:hypothetical protein
MFRAINEKHFDMTCTTHPGRPPAAIALRRNARQGRVLASVGQTPVASPASAIGSTVPQLKC